MERYALEDIPLSRLSRDDAYSLRFPGKGSGYPTLSGQVLIPLLVAQGAPHVIVSGHRRRASAESSGLASVPALVLREALPPKDLFLLALEANAGQIYSPAEKALALKKAGAFGLSETEAREKVMPLLGGEDEERYEDLLLASRLHPKLLDLIHEDRLSFRAGQPLSKFSAADQETFAGRVASNLCLSASQAVQAAEWLRELCAEEKTGIEAFLASSGLLELLLKEKGGDRRQKTDSFMKQLRRLRFPRLTEKEALFEREARKVEKNLPGVRIEAPPHFEDQGIFMRCQIRDQSALEALVASLSENKTSLNWLLKVVL